MIKSLPSEIKIHEINPTLRHIEFFGLSFWLALWSKHCPHLLVYYYRVVSVVHWDHRDQMIKNMK